MSGLTMLQLKIATPTLSLLSVVVALLRLAYRYWTARMWWDDAAVAVAMVLQIFQVIFTQIRYDPEKFNRYVLVAGYYVAALSFLGVVWFSRISILFTIMRISIHKSTRRYLGALAGLFLLTCLVLQAQVMWTCEGPGKTSWKHEPIPQCFLGKEVAVAQVITDVLADLFLIIAPVRLVWKVRLSRPQKIRIIAIFCSASATTIVSLCHAYFLLTVGGLKEIMAGIVEMSVSLIVANLNVIVAVVYRISSDNTDIEKSDKHIVTFGALPSRRRRPQWTDLDSESVPAERPFNHLQFHVTTTIQSESAVETEEIPVSPKGSQNGDNAEHVERSDCMEHEKVESDTSHV